MAVWSYQPPAELSDQQYARWQQLLEDRTGICFLERKSILQAGLDRRMRELGLKNYEQYFARVALVPEGLAEWAQLVDRIAVKETSFFRQPEAYQAVRRFLLQRLHDDPNCTINLWSAGCATGEEAYSLAMTTQDMIDYTQASAFFGVLATDISQQALVSAKAATYNARKVEMLRPETRQQYFAELPNGLVQLRPALREQLCFTQSNLLQREQAPKLKMDIIYCQNVLVYFRRERHKQIMDMFAEQLKPGGLLVIGPGEVVGWQHPLMRRSSDGQVQAYERLEDN